MAAAQRQRQTWPEGPGVLHPDRQRARLAARGLVERALLIPGPVGGGVTVGFDPVAVVVAAKAEDMCTVR